MNPINYIKGDATLPQTSGVKIICHVCNDVGGWGKGFVMAVSKRWEQPERDYREWHAGGKESGFELGKTQFIQVEPDTWVANMVAQRGLRRDEVGPPIRYEAVAACLQQVAEKAQILRATVHMPRIGCGLAGGEWAKIEPLIEEHLTGRGVTVTVYDFG